MSEKRGGMKDTPSILFRDQMEQAGFQSSTTSNEAAADATTIVRELIQNAQDAAKEAKRARTEIRFEVETISLTDCPGMDRFGTAYDLALKTQTKMAGGTLPDIARNAAKCIGNALEKKKVSLLSISDNGIGLTRKTMKNILGDGQSGKVATQGGSYGYGHLTVIPSSDLRLVYYGGTADEMVASGHCILAPFKDADGNAKGKDGYLADDLKDDLFDPYDFPTGERVPDLIVRKLDQIKSEWGSGTVVFVPAFDYFGDKPDKLWPSIRQAVATNFLMPLLHDEMRIEFRADGKIHSLDSNSVKSAVEECASEKRSRFLSGKMAKDCLDVFLGGEEIRFHTDLGDVRGKLVRHKSGLGMQRIDLWRNGMWIADNGKGHLPLLRKAAFSDYGPFHLCLLIQSEDGEIHRLVRTAEPPLHDDLNIKRLTDEDERRKLREAFRRIRDHLKGRLDKLNTDSLQMEGILSLPIGGTGSGGDPGIHAGEWEAYDRRPKSANGKITVDVGDPERKRKTPKPKKGGGSGGSTRTARKPGNPAAFHAVPVMAATGQCEVNIIAVEDISKVEIRFLLDESMDATCDQMDNEPLVCLKNVGLNGTPVSESMLVMDEGHVCGILLDGFSKDKNYRLSFDVYVPGDTAVGKMALKAEVVRRK